MRVTYLSLLFASSIFMAACGGSTPAANDPSATGEAAPAGERESHGAPAAGEATGPLKAPGEAQVGDRSTCPVSGEEFVVTAESPKVEHEGKTYYMCCPGCAKKFQAEPAKYINKPAT